MQVPALIMRMVITPSHFIATLAQARPKSTRKSIKSFNCDYYIGRSLPSHCSKLSLARPLSSQVPPAQKLSEEDKKFSEEDKKFRGGQKNSEEINNFSEEDKKLSTEENILSEENKVLVMFVR